MVPDINKLRTEDGNVWLEDGIIMMKMGENCSLEVIEKLAEKFANIAKTLDVKPRVLINTSDALPAYNILWRKKIVNILRNAFRDPGFEKIALWGVRTPIIKVVTEFILGATGLDNIRYFDTENEALKWIGKSKKIKI